MGYQYRMPPKRSENSVQQDDATISKQPIARSNISSDTQKHGTSHSRMTIFGLASNCWTVFTF
jgi:hypothetical protein